LLLYRDFLVNINRICVFALVFNIYTKSSTISAIKNIKYILIHIYFFVASKNNNNKKEAISFCAIALITSIIKKYKDCTSNLAFQEFVFFSSSNANNIN